VRNTTDQAAAFLLTFNPPPPITAIEALRARYAQRGGGIKPAEAVEALLKG
jgi:hypothetical protein